MMIHVGAPRGVTWDIDQLMQRLGFRLRVDPSKCLVLVFFMFAHDEYDFSANCSSIFLNSKQNSNENSHENSHRITFDDFKKIIHLTGLGNDVRVSTRAICGVSLMCGMTTMINTNGFFQCFNVSMCQCLTLFHCLTLFQCVNV